MTIERGESIRQLCDEFMSGSALIVIFLAEHLTEPISQGISDLTVLLMIFTTDTEFDIPVVKLADVPNNVAPIVVSSIVDGRPIQRATAIKKVVCVAVIILVLKTIAVSS
jgi:hypothetical protein